MKVMEQMVTFFNIPNLGKCWEKRDDVGLVWPENPSVPALEVWQHIITGEKIIRRYNSIGELTYSNENLYGYPL